MSLLEGWNGFDVVESRYVEPGQMFVIGQSLHVNAATRRRWWWKPWTWRRRNVISGVVRIKDLLAAGEAPKGNT